MSLLRNTVMCDVWCVMRDLWCNIYVVWWVMCPMLNGTCTLLRIPNKCSIAKNTNIRQLPNSLSSHSQCRWITFQIKLSHLVSIAIICTYPLNPILSSVCSQHGGLKVVLLTCSASSSDWHLNWNLGLQFRRRNRSKFCPQNFNANNFGFSFSCLYF